VRTLMQRGVTVFSRPSLHAKFVIASRILIASSANVSRNSREILDEAGIITTDPAAIQRAADFFEKLCTEPVGKKYLAQCIKEYQPPKFKAAIERPARRGRSQRITEAKLWFVGGLVTLDLSDKDQESMHKLERRAEQRLKAPAKTEVRWIRYGKRPRFFRAIRSGDWVVDCVRDGNIRNVGPPARVLCEEEWISPRGTKHAVLMLESPRDGESMTLGRFRKRIKAIEPTLDRLSPRTKPIPDKDDADRILRLWMVSGKVAK
jgi:hypothetical protein